MWWRHAARVAAAAWRNPLFVAGAGVQDEVSVSGEVQVRAHVEIRGVPVLLFRYPDVVRVVLTVAGSTDSKTVSMTTTGTVVLETTVSAPAARRGAAKATPISVDLLAFTGDTPCRPYSHEVQVKATVTRLEVTTSG